MPALLLHPSANRLQPLRSTQGITPPSADSGPLDSWVSFCRPFLARLHRGPDAVPSARLLPLAALLRGLLAKRATERDERQSTKKRP